MRTTAQTAVAVIGIDIGKNSFHIVGLDHRGAIVLGQKWSRGQVEVRLANMSPCLIGMDRERLVSQRTGIINQIRAFLLERGIAVRQGRRFFRAELPRILAIPPDVVHVPYRGGARVRACDRFHSQRHDSDAGSGALIPST